LLSDSLSLPLDDLTGLTNIEPTKEWQNEIEAALSTCDALVALLHPGFHVSMWTDQEIGYAMGRGIPVYSVGFGQKVSPRKYSSENE
jgi:nucleoside 2-deoxyribosyltransferase